MDPDPLAVAFRLHRHEIPSPSPIHGDAFGVSAHAELHVDSRSNNRRNDDDDDELEKQSDCGLAVTRVTSAAVGGHRRIEIGV
jgi:hypothetical protein